MRVLQLVPRCPLPLSDGGKIGIFGFTKAFAALGHTVRLLGFDEEGASAECSTELNRACEAWSFYPIPSFRVLSSKARVLAGAGVYLRDKYRSTRLENAVLSAVSDWRPDLVHVDHSHMGYYARSILRKYPNSMVILRAHNVESKIWERRSQIQRNWVLRKAFSKQYWAARAYERDVFSAVNGVLCISDVDECLIRQDAPSTPTYRMSAGMMLHARKDLRDGVPSPLTLCFVGSLEYTANSDGLLWFFESIWPAVRARFPSARMLVAGKGSAFGSRLSRYVGVNYLGFVDDLQSVVATADIALVPLRVGGGIRIKMLDFMSRGIPIVATTIGAEGVPTAWKGSPTVQLADDAEGFVRKIELLVYDGEMRNAQVDAAFNMVATDFGWESLVRGYLEWVASLRVQQQSGYVGGQ